VSAAHRSRVVLDGLGFPEGPRYRDGRLWFSDIFDFTVNAWEPQTGRKTVLASLDDKPSGLGFLPDGTLLIVTIDRMQLLRLDAGGPRLVADLRAICGERHHLNDMVVDGLGRAYIGGIDKAKRASKILLVEPDGTVRIAAEHLAAPNGMAISADGATFVTADNGAHAIVALDIVAGGTLVRPRTFAQLDTFPDGLCLDAAGAAWVGLPFAGEFRRIEPGGTVTERVAVDAGRVAVAPMLGGPERRTLYLCTARKLPLEEHHRIMDHPARLPDALELSRGAIEAVDGVAVPGAGWP
jgi:sugar lactone lactonase YvrE